MNLEELIKQRITLGRIGNTGFQSTRCAVCNDYKDRCGFNFEGNEIRIHCFNCSLNTTYTKNTEHISKRFRYTLNAFGITNEEINNVIADEFFKKKDDAIEIITLASIKKKQYSTPEQQLPPNSILIREGDAEWQYLVERNINPYSYRFYKNNQSRYKDRVIIPFYKHSKLIFWQARSILKNEKQRYLNCPVAREAIIFKYDDLLKQDKSPVYVCEGIFDALSIDGIALLGSTLNEPKIEAFQKTHRDLIFVIDPDDTGYKLGNHVLDLGWKITMLDTPIDVNESIKQYGKLFTAKMIVNNTKTPGLEARLMLDFKCRRNNI